jgi:hypothetical protein
VPFAFLGERNCATSLLVFSSLLTFAFYPAARKLAMRTLWTLCLIGFGAYSWYSLMQTPEPPPGEWLNLANGSCETTNLRFRFGNDVTLANKANKADTALFARRALYSYGPTGEMRMAFVMDNSKGPLDVRIVYQVGANVLVPKVVRVNDREQKSPLPDSVVKNFTFRRCATPA